MDKIKQNKFQFIFICAAILLAYYLFIDPFHIFQQTVFYNFQARDIDRARQILKGNLIFYGPEMTGGGNLPGPLYYITLAIGQIFNYTWKSAWLIEFIFIFVGGIFGSLYFLKKDNINIPIIWIILFASAPLTAWFIKIFLNTSLIIPFVVACIILSKKAFLETSKNSHSYYYLAFLAIGLGIQYHYSIICFLPALIYANFQTYKKFSIKNTILGFSIFLIPSLPHIFWLIFRKIGHPFGAEAFYSGDAEQSIVSLFYLIKLNFSIISQNLFKSWSTKILTSFPLIFFPLGISYAFIKRKITPDEKFFLIFLAFSFLPYFNWYFSGQAIRYTIPFYICLLFLTTELFSNMLSTEKQIFAFNILSIISIALFLKSLNTELNYQELKFFVFENLLLILLFSILNHKAILNRFSLVLTLFCITFLSFIQKELISSDRVFSSKSQEGYMLNYDEWSKIASIIYQNTGKKFEDYKYQIYYIGHHVNQSPVLALEDFNYLPSKQNTKLINPDGFIISNRFGNMSASKKRNSKSPINWILRQNIHSDLKNAIENNYISFDENLSTDRLIVPYYVNNPLEFPKHFHNLSAGYNISKEDLELEKIKKNGVLKLDSNHYLFKWNENPDQSSYCSTGIKIDLSRFGSEKIIGIRIIGSTLSQITPWISPNWTQSWDDTYLEATCGSQKITTNVVESIGFNRKYSHRASVTPFFAGNNSFAAPFERDLKINCREKLSTLTIGRKSSTVDMITSTKKLSAQALTIDFLKE